MLKYTLYRVLYEKEDVIKLKYYAFG